MREFAIALRQRTLRALGLPFVGVAGVAGAGAVAACAAADRDVVMAPMAAPVVDAGSDAAWNDPEGGAEGGARHALRPLREPAAKPNCQRNVRCRPPDDEEQSVPYPEPFAHCSVSLAKDRRDVTFSPKETKNARVNEADVCCYVEFHSCSNRTIQIMEGRALRVSGRVCIPASRGRAADAALATKWTRAAENEHASIAAFARITLELMALGAPMDLVSACQRAGADEVRHSADSYALASRYAGHPISAMPFAAACAPIAPDVVRLARDTLIDGCIGESAAALLASRDAEYTHDTAEKAVLQGISRDESSHAELAFELLAWTIAVGGQPVRDMIREELDAIARTTSDADEPLPLAVHSVAAPIIAELMS